MLIKDFILSDFPQLWLRLGQNLVQDKIKEGDDVYFDCEVSANPRINKLVWKHDVSTEYRFINAVI